MRAAIALAALIAIAPCVARADDNTPNRPIVHVVGESGLEIQYANFVHRNGGTIWRTVCTSPCTGLGTPDGYYHIEDAENMVYVRGRREFTLVINTVTTRGSHWPITVGAIMAGAGMTSGAFATGCINHCDSATTGLLLGSSLTVLLVGLVVLFAGVGNRASNSTRLDVVSLSHTTLSF